MENKTIIINMGWKFLERIGAQLVTFIVSIVLARILLPEHYGVVAIVTTFIAIANVFVENGFGNALIQKKDSNETDFSSVFYINVFFSIVIYIFLYFLSPFIAHFFGNDLIGSLLKVLGIRIILASINSIQKAYISKTMQFKRFFISTLFGTIISGFVGIALAMKGFGAWAIVAQYLTNTTTDTIILWLAVKWRPQNIFSIKSVRVLFNYGWKILAAALINTFYQESRNLCIGKIYSASDLALFNKGNSYPKLIMDNVNISISTVMFPVLSQMQDNVQVMREKISKSIRVYSYFIFPMMAGLAIVAKPLIIFMLTEKWVGCIPYLKIYCISYATWVIQVPIQEGIKALGRSDAFLKLEVIRKILGFLILVAFLKIGPLAIAISIIVNDFISIGLIFRQSTNILGYGFIQGVKDIIKPIVYTMLMSTVVIIVGLFFEHVILKLCIQVMSGTFCYISISWLTKDSTFIYCKDLFISSIRKQRL